MSDQTHTVRTEFMFCPDDEGGGRLECVLHLSTDQPASSYGRPVVVDQTGDAVDQFSLLFHYATHPEEDAAGLAAFREAGYKVPVRI